MSTVEVRVPLIHSGDLVPGEKFIFLEDMERGMCELYIRAPDDSSTKGLRGTIKVSKGEKGVIHPNTPVIRIQM